MITATPIPFWLSLPLGELSSWAETVLEVKENRG